MAPEYYNLREQPFGVTPDYQYLYSSATHREALASLLYGLEAGRGFVALIAKPGMGKTTLLFQALNQLKDKARVVFLFQTVCTPVDFMRAVLADLGIHEAQGSLIELQARFNDVITEQSRLGKPIVIVIDEAQNLDDSVLELVRMLSNFETSREKLIQIILSGQPQLADKLASPELVQLRQRISIVACLKPLSPEETAHYIDHRLRKAGYNAEASLFTDSALALIADCSEGIPRNINNLCFNAISLGCALKQATIDCDIVREIVADLNLEPLRERNSPVSRPKKDDTSREVVDDLDLESSQEGESFSSRVEAGSTQGVPAFASVASAPLMLTGWAPKLVLACAILAVFSGALFQSHRWLTPKTAVLAGGGIPPLVAVLTPSSGIEPKPQMKVPTRTIRVTAGQSLYRICGENFGRCSSAGLQEIRTLNPWLSNLNHIESGQRIRVPVAQKLPGAALSVVEQSGNVSPTERGLP